ncbi:MAG: cation-translocating P-type ATPase [Chitinophagales bacterium]
MPLKHHTGLTDAEVIESRQTYGTNALEQKAPNALWQVVKEIVSEPLFIILVCAAIIYFVLGQYNEGIIMLVALGFVSGISVYQENKSRNAVAALKKLAAPKAKVIRNGTTRQIDAEEVVMNDLLVLEDGGIIPADARVLEAHDFSVNESILTGEALAVIKDSSETNNYLYGGTLVTGGNCMAQVTGIGKQSAFGKISEQLQHIQIEKTPLQLQIKAFVKGMVSVGVVAFFIVWGINYYLTKSILNSLLHGLTLAMSVLPEEIPVAFSTFMALGAYHLYKLQVIVRNPHTVETLGAATVICTDKTGTITENQMQLAAVYDFAQDKLYDYTQQAVNYTPVLEYAMWASESEPFDHMEKSIHQAYATTTPGDQRATYSMFHEYPLGGKPPIMTHVFSNGKGHHIIACKGSVEGVLQQCNLSIEQKTRIQDTGRQLAGKGFRVLAVATSQHNPAELPASQHQLILELTGLIAFYDPPKANIATVLQQFYDAGIRVKIITGDYAETAIAIANQINFNTGDEPLTGEQVMALPDSDLQVRVLQTNLFARMFPEAKLKVIEALKAAGEVVAMTGDGVNDGPALKAAHIGIAMGHRGSELAKSTAGLILMDDDLSHMTEAIALGRRIYENLKKAIRYIISIHIPIILIVTIPLLFFWAYTDFFSPIHVIFLELIMGPTCSIIFENEPIEANSMSRPPRKMSTNFFSLRELSLSIIQGLVITTTCLGLGFYFMQSGKSETFVRTIIYTTLLFSNVFLTLVNRSFYYSVVTTLRYRNWMVPLVLLITLAVLFTSIYLAPVRHLFSFEVLPVLPLLLCLAVAFVGVIWLEGYKFYQRKTHPVTATL